MASIRKSRSHENSSAEMQVTIRGTESGAEYVFTLKRRHIEVEQPGLLKDKNNQHAKGKKSDWFTTLTDEEKVQVFAVILDEYRNRSLGDAGFKGASIGVANEKMGSQSRLFIGTNTTRWASPYFKHCAEQNMVNAATDTLMYERSLRPEEKQKAPKAPKFKSVYVLQAIDEKKVPISCPCGKCTDMLSSVMVPHGEIVTVPFLTDKAREVIKNKAEAVIVNTAAQTLDQIPLPNGHDTYEVWKTTIENLNRNREIELVGKKAPIATIQRDALRNYILGEAKAETGLPEGRAKADMRAMVGQMRAVHIDPPTGVVGFLDKLAESVRSSGKMISQKIRNLVGDAQTTAAKAAENELIHRHSVAPLDCAMESGRLDLKQLNKFMLERITETLAHRMRCDKDTASMDIPQLQKWAENKINYIRCVAIQLDDGTFRYAVQAESAFDKAMPNAEVAALEQATESLGVHGVRNVWAMEMNPMDIKRGILRTSPKEGIERLLKRASTTDSKGIKFHYLPFNNGSYSSDKLQNMIVEGGAKEFYSSNFKGQEVPTAESGRRTSWVDLVKQVAANDASIPESSQIRA